MPNYVHHNLTITGAADERRRFLKECFTDTEKGPTLDFGKLIPEPQWPQNRSGLADRPGAGDLILGAGKAHGVPEWYEWRCANWNTKWNACCCQVSDEGDDTRLSFDTAWAVPYPIFVVIAERFPKLSVDGYFYEEIGHFEGTVHCHGGEADLQCWKSTCRLEATAAMEDNTPCALISLGWDKDEQRMKVRGLVS